MPPHPHARTPNPDAIPGALPSVGVTLALALVAHVLLWPYIAPDVDIFLIPWMTHIRDAGIPGAFAVPFGNYMPAYLYLMAMFAPLASIIPMTAAIKLLSIAGTAALAGAAWRMLLAFKVKDAARGAALIFVLPTTLANAPLLAQCDALWAAPCVMALAMAVERRHAAMLAWFGLALAIKLQAAFLGPFILGLLIARRVPIHLWAIVPLTAGLTVVPALAAGWPLADLLAIYTKQAGQFDALSLNAPNIWAIVQIAPLGSPLGGLATVAAIGASVTYVAWLSSRPLPDPILPMAALLAPLLVVGLLPRMHERFFFLADILALATALLVRDRRGWIVAGLVQTGSLLALLGYLTGKELFVGIGAIAMIAATLRVARSVQDAVANANDNPLPLRMPQRHGIATG